MLLFTLRLLFDDAKVTIISHISLFFLRFFLSAVVFIPFFDLCQEAGCRSYALMGALLNERKYIHVVHVCDTFFCYLSH